MRTWEQNVTLSPESQAIYDTNLRGQGAQANVALTATNRLADEYSNAMDWSGLTPYAKPTGAMAQYGGGQGTTGASRNPYGVGGPQTVRQPSNNTQGGGYMSSRTRNQSSGGPSGNSAAVDAIYEQQMRRIDPQYDRQREALQDQLRNQGMRPEDFAWQQQMQDMDEGYNDASEMARLSSFEEGRKRREVDIQQQMASVASQNAGTAAQQARWANELANNQLTNSQRQQQYLEMLGMRAQGLNESQALRSGAQVAMPNHGGYNPSTAAAPSNALNAGIAQGNALSAQSQGFWGGLGDLAGAGMQAYGLSLGAPPPPGTT